MLALRPPYLPHGDRRGANIRPSRVCCHRCVQILVVVLVSGGYLTKRCATILGCRVLTACTLETYTCNPQPLTLCEPGAMYSKAVVVLMSGGEVTKCCATIVKCGIVIAYNLQTLYVQFLAFCSLLTMSYSILMSRDNILK